MARSLLPIVIALAAVAIAWQVGLETTNQAQAAFPRSYYAGEGGVFPGYYVGPGAGGAVARMYPCPCPTPPVVGHTFVPYQPLLPQEFLYRHARSYRRYNAEGGVTTTRVWWH